MKGNFTGIISRGILPALVFFLAFITCQAQQNNTLFFMYSLPESNFVNPAVQGGCGDFIGLPVISSFHMNIANSGFTAGNVIKVFTNGSIQRRPDFNTDRMGDLNYFLSEFHSTLLAVGLQRNDNYYTFTVTEKDDETALYTRDLTAFILRGDPEFEGEHILLKGMNMSLNHYREFAFGISKKFSGRLILGAKAKVLFGEFNFTTGNSTFGIYVDENSDDLIFEIDGGYNSSLPYSLQEESPGTYRFYNRYDAPIGKYMTNLRNPGFALDFGFIYKYSERMTFSGSLLDLGMIFYRSNTTNYHLSGSYAYNGPFGRSMITDTYLWDVFDELNQNMSSEVTENPYTYTLSPRMYLGTAYQWKNWLDVNFLLYNRYLPHKLQTGATASLLAKPSDNFEASVSWSYMNRSITNVGVGFSYLMNSLQLYVVSDNILGMILPMSTKNVNIRLGINLKLGCKERFNIDQCGCAWLRDAETRRARMESARRKK
jgi:hypothetical protein